MFTAHKVYLEVVGSEEALQDFLVQNKGVMAQRSYDKFVTAHNGFTAYFEGHNILETVSSLHWNPTKVTITIGYWL